MITDLRDPYEEYHDESLEQIAYFQGKRIVRDSIGDLFFEIIPYTSQSVTDLLNKKRLTPITELSKEEQEAIWEFVKDVD